MNGVPLPTDAPSVAEVLRRRRLPHGPGRQGPLRALLRPVPPLRGEPAVDRGAPRPTGGSPAAASSTSRSPPTAPWAPCTTPVAAAASTPRRSGMYCPAIDGSPPGQRGRRRRHRRAPGQGQPHRPRDLPHRLGRRPDHRLARLARRRRRLVLLDELPRPAPPLGPAGVRDRAGSTGARSRCRPATPRTGPTARRSSTPSPATGGPGTTGAGVQLRGAGRLGARHPDRRPGARGERPQRRRGRAHRRGARAGCSPASAERGWADDVDVVFTTDHGELQGDFGLLFKGPYHVDALMRLPLVWRPAPSSRTRRRARAVGRAPAGGAGRPGPDLLRHRRHRAARVDAGARPCRSTTPTPRPAASTGPHRVGQRAVRHRRPPAHHDARPLGGAPPTGRAPATTAPRASSTTWSTTRCSGSTAGTTRALRPLRDDLVADLWDSQPQVRADRLPLEAPV